MKLLIDQQYPLEEWVSMNAPGVFLSSDKKAMVTKFHYSMSTRNVLAKDFNGTQAFESHRRSILDKLIVRQLNYFLETLFGRQLLGHPLSTQSKNGGFH